MRGTLRLMKHSDRKAGRLGLKAGLPGRLHRGEMRAVLVVM